MVSVSSEERDQMKMKTRPRVRKEWIVNYINVNDKAGQGKEGGGGGKTMLAGQVSSFRHPT